jgi:hypothetical protein
MITIFSLVIVTVAVRAMQVLIGLILILSFFGNAIYKQFLGCCICGLIAIAFLAIALLALSILFITFSNKFVYSDILFSIVMFYLVGSQENW